MSVEISIEKGVVLDTSYYCRWPFKRMEVGDSFFTEVEAKRVSSAASYYSKRHPGFKFVTRTVKENGKSGTRVWRVRR